MPHHIHFVLLLTYFSLALAGLLVFFVASFALFRWLEAKFSPDGKPTKLLTRQPYPTGKQRAFSYAAKLLKKPKNSEKERVCSCSVLCCFFASFSCECLTKCFLHCAEKAHQCKHKKSCSPAHPFDGTTKSVVSITVVFR